MLFALLQALLSFVAVGLWWFLGRGAVSPTNYFNFDFPFSIVLFTSMAAASVGYWPVVWIVYPFLARLPQKLRLGALFVQPFFHLLVLIGLAEGDKALAFSFDYPGWAFAICGSIGAVVAAIVVERKTARAASAPRR